MRPAAFYFPSPNARSDSQLAGLARFTYGELRPVILSTARAIDTLERFAGIAVENPQQTTVTDTISGVHNLRATRAGCGRNSMAKAEINGPTKNASDYGYQTECRIALEASFSKLIEEAVKSGWPKQQVTYSLMIMAAQELSTMKRQEPPNEIAPPA